MILKVITWLAILTNRPTCHIIASYFGQTFAQELHMKIVP
jgi:hypothetical protein